MRCRKKVEDLVGQRFNKLMVTHFIGWDKHNRSLWECSCECGGSVIVRGNSLKTGNTKSCGCLHEPHGATGSPEFEAWVSAIKRCNNPNLANYGGRGIIVCKRWQDSFANFLADMGKKPDARYSIDREDNSKGYECGKCDDCLSRGTTKLNCRWATAKQQARNRRSNLLITCNGETHLLSEWVAILGVSRVAIKRRHSQGNPIDKPGRTGRPPKAT